MTDCTVRQGGEEDEAFLQFMQERLSAAEGLTTKSVPLMKIAATEFALNGRRLVAMARAAIEAAPGSSTHHQASGKGDPKCQAVS